ncbi:MAG: nuclear transport factor 2 family protein [Actinobacteria bacterium]|nr:nuclear transport factor 2 family protein [Actinomycetota bacterium]
MAHPNEDIIRQAYAAFSSGDMDALSGSMADDVTWHVPGDSPIAGDYEGKEAVFGFFGKLAELSGGTLNLGVHDILANDEHAVALVRTTASREGRELDQNAVHVMHVRDGQVTEFWSTQDDQAEADAFWS